MTPVLSVTLVCYWSVSHFCKAAFKMASSTSERKTGNCSDTVPFWSYWQDKLKDEAISSSPNRVWSSMLKSNHLVIVFKTLLAYSSTFSQCAGAISCSTCKFMRTIIAYFAFLYRRRASGFLVIFFLFFSFTLVCSHYTDGRISM